MGIPTTKIAECIMLSWCLAPCAQIEHLKSRHYASFSEEDKYTGGCKTPLRRLLDVACSRNVNISKHYLPT